MFSTIFGPAKIVSAEYVTDANVEKKHARFSKLLEKEGLSKDQGTRFLVTQLGKNKAIYDALLSKRRLGDTDRTSVDLFYNPINRLADAVISDAGLRSELKFYNDFLRSFYKNKIREKQSALAQYERIQARAATKTQGLDAKMQAAKLKFMKLGMTEQQANEEIAKARGFAASIVPAAAAGPSPADPVADAAVDNRVRVALNELFAGMSNLPIRSDILSAVRAAKLPDLNLRLSANETVSENNVRKYMANMQAKQTADLLARMPMPPTSSAKRGGFSGDRTRRRQSRKQSSTRKGRRTMQNTRRNRLTRRNLLTRRILLTRRNKDKAPA
jgi:hypothetical protein